MSRNFMPPALAKLFSGTSLAISAPANGAAPAADEGDDEIDGPLGPNATTNADAARIAANAQTAVNQGIEATNKRWADVLRHETGEGDEKATIMSQPARATAAIDLLADTDMAADKIIATVSKPAFAGTVAPAAGNGVDPIAAAAARERMRGAEQPDTSTGADAGGDGTGAGAETSKARVKESRKKTAETRNKSVQAKLGGAAQPTA